MSKLEILLSLLVLVGASGAVITRWRKGILHTVREKVRWIDAKPILCAIAEEFQPNGGSSLRDTIDRIEATQERHKAHADDRFDSIENKIDTFIMCRQPDGRRFTDHTHGEEQ